MKAIIMLWVLSFHIENMKTLIQNYMRTINSELQHSNRIKSASILRIMKCGLYDRQLHIIPSRRKCITGL